MNKILESTKYVVGNASFVSVDKEKIGEFASNFEHSHAKHWLLESPFDISKLTSNEALHFLVVFNAISFSYWGTPKWAIEYEGKKFDGAYGMIVAMGRALEEGHDLLDFSFLQKMTEDKLNYILRGNAEIPLLKERLLIMKELGVKIDESYGGKFENLLNQSAKVEEILDILIKELPSFDDTTNYHSHEVFFYKRAQLLLSDIHQMSNVDFNFENPEELTACADYKLPQALRKFGILKYSDQLANKIDAKIELEAGSKEEVEIRSGVIWGVEYIRQELLKKHIESSSMDINDHLWLLTQTKKSDDKPYHLVRTTAY